MIELDLSQHSLNNSSSKMKYSFPKTKRFGQIGRAICDSMYELPTTFSKRSTSLGYGQKDLGIKNTSHCPGAGNYNIESQFDPQKILKKGISFGTGRQKMDIGGPLKDVRVLKHIPGPGNYQLKSIRDNRAPSLRSRLPDTSLKMILKNPGPGTYQREAIGTNNYYMISKFKNTTNLKISQVSRSNQLQTNKRISVGPADYDYDPGMKKSGRYSLGKYHSVNGGVFSKSSRQDIVEKCHLLSPGPGQYKNSISSFGQR